MYGNYNTGYGMSPYQQQLAQNRLNQMEQGMIYYILWRYRNKSMMNTRTK